MSAPSPEHLAELEKSLAQLERRFEREKRARKEAERLLESKSLELYQSNQSLQALSQSLEKQVIKRTKELEAEKNNAIYLSQIKSKFVATMSHEIRTPLNGIISVLDLLKVDNGDDKTQLLSIAQHSSKTLLNIINDILDFSKIEAGQMRIETITFDLRKLLHQIHLSFMRRAHLKNIEINLHIDKEVPQYVHSDPTRITQILNNYLSNGIKFTEFGSVQLNVMQQAQWINFSVCDSGVGIPQEKLDLLFKDFSQVDTSTTRKYGGTGLGLVITKRIVEIMNGKVHVSSKLGSGSCFSAILPLQSADYFEGDEYDYSRTTQVLNEHFNDALNLQEEGHSEVLKSDKAKSKGHILLVDDNAVNRLVGEKTLHALEFEVTLSPSGFDAIDKLSVMHDYDLVLMDCQMPEMSGYDATRILRSKNLHLPILALTANSSEEDRSMAFQAGMDDFICKPFSIDTIKSILQKFLPHS
ncbi:hypothetical protein THMIRHAS_07920 [Thiosulfatimonas sediminis]|uniref:histidine kinase n=1 Tax=Thiosulfatimonas sediminis TaxID=2675054 RepID=A0A6F8PTI5_9GAMM|nr:ATP-binding protein [Thiosulfatimonas sediminis]BBP45419.1 hypothetical protein THMIRHAS_07920 [Thiosulfatimonas sediminis]